jgi:hypothetical protein
MKKLAFAFLFITQIAIAQDASTNIISLQSLGLNAELDTKGKFDSEVQMHADEEAGMKMYNLKFDDGNKLEITALKKPLTGAVMMKMAKDLAAKKQKNFTVKIIKQSTNELLIMRSTESKTIYKSMYVAKVKGKEYLISSDDVDDLQTAQDLLEVSKSFKVK